MNRLEQIWYQAKSHPLSLLLAPFGWIYCLTSVLRRKFYQSGLLHSEKLPVPVFIVGNITAGGTGKTPLVIWLIQFLEKQGLNPGIISRGYGGKAKDWPQEVSEESDPVLVGDEPVVIARNTQSPLYVAPDRVEAGKRLLQQHNCDIIVCDDGLQHYSLHRDFEICVIDGTRRHGNQRCLPAGPLREPVSRLHTVDAIVCNGSGFTGEYRMRLELLGIRQIRGTGTKTFEDFREQKVHVVAGIGNPKRFFDSLRGKGLDIIEHPFPDHAAYRAEDFNFSDHYPIIMTEKDAVKCVQFAEDHFWYVAVEAVLPETFEFRLSKKLKELKAHG